LLTSSRLLLSGALVNTRSAVLCASKNNPPRARAGGSGQGLWFSEGHTCLVHYRLVTVDIKLEEALAGCQEVHRSLHLLF
jgi:hypothetical protein